MQSMRPRALESLGRGCPGCVCRLRVGDIDHLHHLSPFLYADGPLLVTALPAGWSYGATPLAASGRPGPSSAGNREPTSSPATPGPGGPSGKKEAVPVTSRPPGRIRGDGVFWPSVLWS